MIVDSSYKSSKALGYLAGETLLGFDTETRPTFVSNNGKPHRTSLLQLATDNMVFLFRLPFCGINSGLMGLLSNQEVTKVGVAVRDDIKGLLTYRSFSPAGFIDLQSMAEPLGVKEKSLRKLAAIFLTLRLSKGQQLSNWDKRVLSSAQQKYAALDAWACREIYLKLINNLKNEP